MGSIPITLSKKKFLNLKYKKNQNLNKIKKEGFLKQMQYIRSLRERKKDWLEELADILFDDFPFWFRYFFSFTATVRTFNRIFDDFLGIFKLFLIRFSLVFKDFFENQKKRPKSDIPTSPGAHSDLIVFIIIVFYLIHYYFY